MLNVGLETPIAFSRSVRQGGVESAWEWNLPMRMILDQLLDQWLGAGIGIDLPGIGLVNHLLWADNVYFLAHSRKDLKVMLTDFSQKLYKLGLFWKLTSLEFLHTNDLDNESVLNVDVGDVVCSFKSVSVMCLLGSELSLDNPIAHPIEHRLRKGDACFWGLKDILLAKDLPLNVRFEEYVKRVQPVVLFSSGCWVWSRQMFFLLYRWENCILRRMAGLRRKTDESFASYQQRSTKVGRILFHKSGRRSLCTLALHRMHSLAGYACCGYASSTASLSMRFLGACMAWRDRDWWLWQQAVGQTLDPSNSTLGWRHDRPGRRLMWENVFVRFWSHTWKTAAAKDDWMSSLPKFVEHAYAQVSATPLEKRFGSQRPALDIAIVERPLKKPRVVPPLALSWQNCGEDSFRVELLGDSNVVTNWIRGIWEVRFAPYLRRVSGLQSQWAGLCNRFNVAPPRDHHDFHRHIFRELNSVADAKANLARCSGLAYWCLPKLPCRPSYIRTFCDGSFKDGVCGAAFVVFISSEPGPSDDAWTQLAWMAFPVQGASITAAELEAAAGAQAFVQSLLQNTDSWQSFFHSWSPWSYC